MLHAEVGARAFPDSVAARLAAGTITRIRVIGQGTAAVAGQSTAAILDELCDGSLDIDADHGHRAVRVQLRLDMSDTLAIAVSQSGTTTDTNRTVDLLRGRGAAVLGHRQPPRAAISSTRPTASCTRRTVATSR